MEWFMEASWRLRAPLCCQTRIPLLFQDGFIGSAKWFRPGFCGLPRVGFGRGWLRPHRGENRSVAFLNRVPGLPHLVPQGAAIDFAGLIEAVASGVEFPATVAAANAVFLDLAVVERGTTVAAARVQQARAQSMPVGTTERARRLDVAGACRPPDRHRRPDAR